MYKRLLDAGKGAAVVLGQEVRVCYCGVQAQTPGLPLITQAVLYPYTRSALE
jgi:hypothetical protein